MSQFKVGDVVQFGRPNGEQSQGTVTKVNPKKLKVRQDEPRGSKPVGTIWTVPPSLCRHVCDGAPVGVALVELPRADPLPDRSFPGPQSGFRRGDRVQFDGRGGLVTGTVRRVNLKTITVDPLVRTDGRYWRVPPRMLRLVTDAA
jgi:hypothetical protein